MAKSKAREDTAPLSEFRAHAAAVIRQLKKTRRRLILTQRGSHSAVLLDVREYQRLMEERELVQELLTADREVERTGGVGHDTVVAEMRRKYGS